MTPEEARELPLGLYRIYWKDEGSSLASVGQCYNGDRWFAPCNWTCETPEEPIAGSWPIARVATTDWSDVDRAVKIELEAKGEAR